VAVKPQRLAQRERHQPVEAGPLERPLQQRATADRLRRDPQRLAASAPHEVAGVVRERVEVDDGERRLDAGERCLQTLVRRHGADPSRAAHWSR
jgi:hypothetical protein